MLFKPQNIISPDVLAVHEGRHHDPFAVLGVHPAPFGKQLRVLRPFATSVWIKETSQILERISGTDIFETNLAQNTVTTHPTLAWRDSQGQVHSEIEPYTFLPQVTDYDLHLFREGTHRHCYEFLGARPHQVDQIDGILFVVWAPNAARVSIVGEFNRWHGLNHPMRVRGESGIWELFIPGLKPGQYYKYEIKPQHGGRLLLKSDPYARQFEKRPGTASVIPANSIHQWQDQAWMQQRMTRDWLHQPMSVYEVHLGSWRYYDQAGHQEFANYRLIAHDLVEYVRMMGFNYIELLPVTEHPFDGSWGYQTTGYFAASSRFGNPDDLKYFIDLCHQNNIGVLLDWVPGHFPRDDFALANFDGTPLYEHADPRRGEHRDWGTLIFNYGRLEVKNFLISSAIFWLKEFHIDGLRVDAVASMLYLDYSREAGDWLPNMYGGNENLEAIEFLRELNRVTHGECPGSLTIAEESTAFPSVTRPTWLGGLGFSMKWNMGWMHDTLLYLSKDPVHRHYHHDNLTFGLLYAFTENFVLPFSHDEVVHGKSSMIYKMPGDEWQRFANLRLLYTYMFTYPGKKLLFMGCEFAQTNEWSHDHYLDWHLLQFDLHKGIQKLVGDLNRLYQSQPVLYKHDFEPAGFDWIDCHDASQSVLSYIRRADNQFLIVILNCTPIARVGYRIGVPQAGLYREIHNSDSEYYGGSNVGNGLGLSADATPWMGRPYSLTLTLPPLAAIVLQPE